MGDNVHSEMTLTLTKHKAVEYLFTFGPIVIIVVVVINPMFRLLYLRFCVSWLSFRLAFREFRTDSLFNLLGLDFSRSAVH